jgi:hypothetical protein
LIVEVDSIDDDIDFERSNQKKLTDDYIYSYRTACLNLYFPPWASSGTSRPLKLPIDSLTTHLWPMAYDLWPPGVILCSFIPNWSHLRAGPSFIGTIWHIWVRFRSVFLHFSLILMKSIVTTLTTGDDYIDNEIWWLTTRGKLSKSHCPSPPLKI